MINSTCPDCFEVAERGIKDCCAGRPCLKGCLQRLRGAYPPHDVRGGRPRRRVCRLVWLFAGAMAFFLVLFASLKSHGAVVVDRLNDNTVVVSGTGEGDTPTVVITNVVGVCTNCVAITPAELAAGVVQLKSAYRNIMSDASVNKDIARSMQSHCAEKQADISKYYGPLPSYGGNANAYITSLRSYYTEVVQGDHGTQTVLTTNYSQSATGLSASLKNLCAATYAGGIYDYATTYVSPSLASMSESAYDIQLGSENIYDEIAGLELLIDRLDSAEPCTNVTDYVGVTLPGGGGSSTNVSCCCREQLDALLEYVQHIDADQHKRFVQLASISNNVHSISMKMDKYGRQIVDAFYTDYNAIPDGTDWRTLYLSGSPTGWGYNPTNVLERLEALLYGLSGVSTNAGEFASLDDEITADTHGVENLQTDADSAGITSLGSDIVSFFSAFSEVVGAPLSTDTAFTPQVNFEMGETRYQVPSLRLDNEAGSIASGVNSIGTLFRLFMVTVYLLSACFIVFYYWQWFASWCVRLSKWLVEIISSMFAD